MECASCHRVIKQAKYDSHVQRCRPDVLPPPRPVLGRSEREWEEIFPRYPVTQDGYVVSHLFSQPQNYLPLLSKYGFCVVSVFTENECDETVKAMFEDLNSLQDTQLASCKLDPADPSTWEQDNWPNPDGRFLTNVPTFCAQAWRNRLHPAVRETFEHIYGAAATITAAAPQLVTSVDNWGIFRGTQDLHVKGEIVDRPEWSVGLPIHWHVDPWKSTAQEGYSGPKYMALVSLTDSAEEVGGHLTVPGSAAHLATWAAENAELRPTVVKPTLHVPTGAIFKRYTQKIPLRKGEMIIWDIRQAHGAFTNHSNRMRLYQFIRYIPADVASQKADKFSPLNVFAKHPEQRDSVALKSVLKEERDWYIAGLRLYPTEAKTDLSANFAKSSSVSTSLPFSSNSSTLPFSTKTAVVPRSANSSSVANVACSSTSSCSHIGSSLSSSTPALNMCQFTDDDDDDDENELYFDDNEDVVTSDDDDDDTDFEMNEREENFAAVEAVRMAEESETDVSRLNSFLSQLSPVVQVKSSLLSSKVGKLIGAGSLIIVALAFYQKLQRK